MVGQARLPVLGQQSGSLRYFVDVVRQRKRHDVRGQAINHSPRLLPGPAVGLIDRYVLSGLRLPLRREGFIDLLIEFTCRVVRHVEQRRVCRRSVAWRHNQNKASCNHHERH